MESISEDRHELAILAHDIKAPLSAIIDLLILIDKGYVSNPEKSKELVSRAIKKAGTVIKMVDDILDFSKLADKSLMKREKINIFKTLEDSINMMKPYADGRKIRINKCKFCFNEKFILGNHTFLMRVFNNIIMNAIKYNKESGEIFFKSCEKSLAGKEFIIIDIEDTGIGISGEDLKRVFHIFERGSNARKNIDGSIGLGLSLVKQIIEDHDGDIKITSTLGEGTKVSVSLPLLRSKK